MCKESFLIPTKVTKSIKLHFNAINFIDFVTLAYILENTS